MDKYEYKLRSEEIKSLIAKRDFVKAVEIADTIDWSRVRSVSTLCTISDLYKINRRYKEAKELLLRAYEKYPGGRTIVYSLCELCIKTDDIVGAIEYYKEFVQLAPTDNGKFILQYKIYEAQEVSLEERIAVLEELKKREYREKWGYELAYLYHRIGLATKCVEECDELILWFREGKYVKKAMELKMLHQPLSPEQDVLYKRMLPQKEQKEYEEQQTVVYPAIKHADEQEEPDIQVKTMDVGKYNTINLQKELAESMKEVLVAENGFAPLVSEETQEEVPVVGGVTEAIMAPMMQDTEQMQEVFFEEDTEPENVPETLQEPEELPDTSEEPESTSETIPEDAAQKLLEAAREPIKNLIKEQVAEAVETAIREERPTIREVLNAHISNPDFSKVEPPSSMGRLLSQEYDGQISLVVPESERVEKQITGQMNLEDILAEWEKTKKENEEKRKEEVKQRVLQQTGTMFTEFDAKVRDGILEKLEKENDLDTESDSSEELPEVEELEEIQEEEPVSEEAIPDTEAEGEPVEISETETEPEITDSSTEESVEEPKEADPEPEEKPETVRAMTEEEISLFAPFVQTKGARIRLMQALDQISLAAYTGNVFVTGESEEETTELAKNVIREVQITDRNFSGKVAKVTGTSFNNRDVKATISKLENGGLIIEKASGMDAQTTKDLLKALNQEKTGIVVVLQDTRKNMHKMMEYFDGMKDIFNVHIEVEELGDDALVAYGKKYAKHMEYSIDEMGLLALHTRIDELQTSDHIVTVADVREIVDEAIENANKKNLKHLADLLFAKRYDDEDMIILRERDFLD
ncbi:MAG: hypothetical protein ACI39N_00110 [Lachnospiraceae bacterium]